MTHYKNDKKSVSYVRDKETLFYCIGNYEIETLWITSHMEDIHFRLQRPSTIKFHTSPIYKSTSVVLTVFPLSHCEVLQFVRR